MSFCWAWIFVIIGARGRGKTYACKKWLLSGWLFKREKFVILRDTLNECEVIAQDNGVRFWGDVLDDKKFKSKDIKIKMTSTSVFINDELAGYVMPSSLFHLFKGSQYQDCKRVLYDEFIRENSVRYNGDRALQFLNTLMTVARYRTDFKIVLTANALNKGDTILADIFQFQINKFGIYKNKQKGVVLDYTPNSEEFEQYQRSGNVYKLIKGTRYEANLIGNEFVNDDTRIFYDKRKPCSLFGIYHGRDGAVRIYQSKDGDDWYCGNDINPKTAIYMRYAFDVKYTNSQISLGEPSDKKFLQELYKNNLIKFENSYILEMFKNIIK